MSPVTAAQMTRSGVYQVLSASFDLPPDHMSEKTRVEFLQQVFNTFAWCIREELVNTIINESKEAGLTSAFLKDLRETFAVERKTAADNLGDFGRALALQEFPEREGTTH